MEFRGKRVLFLSASLFGYQNEIKKALEAKGAIVDYFDERPANTFFVKAMIRINRNFLAGYIDKYHKKIIEQTQTNRYDFIFITKGESISSRTIHSLRKIHLQAKFVIYHWDSIANNKNAIETLPFFDKVFSFDKLDCEKYSIEFLPLFFLEEYREVAQCKTQRDIDLLFIGTAHSDRYQLVQNIVAQFTKRGLKHFLYIYFPSSVLYYKMKLFNKSLLGTRKSDFKYTPISKEQIINIYKRTNVIVDIQHPRQTGLTMRTIEVIGAMRKLITTNACIKEYDFYNENNILVVDRDNPVVADSFLNSPYKQIPKNIYEKYSIGNWINTIFGFTLNVNLK